MDQSVREALRHDGAVLIQGCLNDDELARCREALDWAVANPGLFAHGLVDEFGQKTHNDNANPLAKDRLDALVATLPFGPLLADLWGSEHVWYFAEEVFVKEGGRTGRSMWHQDTSYLPWTGEHFANAWISFEPLARHNGLEIVRGSHHGPRYNGTTFANPDDPTEPLFEGDPWPRLPDIEAERAGDPSAYDIISWPSEPGDVVILHPATLHGGAPVDAACPDRHTLVFRFFGDDATFWPLPEGHCLFSGGGPLFMDEMAKLQAGDPFRSPVFQQLV